MRLSLLILALTAVLAVPVQGAEDDVDPAALQQSVQQLRSAIGRWNVTTEFLGPDGNVAQSVEGHYEFDWVVPDRVVAGTSELPALDMASGILFYIHEAAGTIEMVSVAADGKLWIMTGPLGGETRYTQVYETPDGDSAQLRFTRFNASDDRFESRMEITRDDGVTWRAANHQVFTRAAAPGG